MIVATPNPSIERTSYRWLRHRQAAAHVERYAPQMPFDLAESFIAAAEEALGARFPGSYREAMARANGGEIEVLRDSWQIHPIADTSDRKRLARTSNHVLRETLSMREWPRFPGNAVAIAANGTGDQLVLLRKSGALEETVYHWSHETGVVEPVAGSFAELSGL